MHDTDSASSLTAVHMFDEKEGWVSGGHMAQLDFEGRYFHTLDGGDTWTKEAIKGLYIFSFDMVSRHSGYSVALTASSGVQLLKYRDNSTDAAVGASSGRVLLLERPLLPWAYGHRPGGALGVVGALSCKRGCHRS